MPRFLILRLDGPMQAWGTHTYEGFRPANPFPTRSGLLGLIAACLGLERRDHPALERLAHSLAFTVRVDCGVRRPGQAQDSPKNPLKLADFHTVLKARKVDGSTNKHPVRSYREYLHDAAFTVAVMEKADAEYRLEQIIRALRQPLFTPVLGRRSCPIARPLLDSGQILEGESAKAVLHGIPPGQGLLYAEGESLVNAQPLSLRDVPKYGRYRQFDVRQVYVHASEQED